MTQVPTVAIVDNHQSILRGVEALIGEVADEFTFVGGFSDPGDLLEGNMAVPDIVILDLWLDRDDADASWAIADLREGGAAVVLYTTEERPVPLRRAVCAGAIGLVLKNDGEDALVETLREVVAGEFVCSSELAAALIEDQGRAANLTSREIEVLELLADGLTKQQGARRLGISPSTFGTHVERIRDKYLDLGRRVPNAVALIQEARRDGYGVTAL